MQHLQPHDQEAFFSSEVSDTLSHQAALPHASWQMHDAAYATHLSQLADGHLVIGYHDGLIKMKNAVSEKTFFATHSRLSTLLALKDGQILSNHANGKTYLWNKQNVRYTEKFTTGQMTSLAELPNGTIAMGVRNSNILLFDLETQQFITGLGAPSLHLSDSLMLLPSGELLSCRYDTGSIYLWDLETKRRLTCFRTHADLYSTALLLDGKHIVTSHRDGNIHVWNIQQEKCVATLSDNSTLIHAVAALPNGHLASGDAEGNIRIWHVFTERCIAIISVKKMRANLPLSTYVNHLLLLSDTRLAYTTNHEAGIVSLACIQTALLSRK
jgi:WD40 repeat protein